MTTENEQRVEPDNPQPGGGQDPNPTTAQTAPQPSEENQPNLAAGQGANGNPPSGVQTGNQSDVVIATVVAVLLYGGLLWVACAYSKTSANIKFPLLFLCIIVGATLGWVAGVLASPYNVNEKSSFAEFGKLIYGFLSGYVVSKLDPIITNALGGKDGGSPHEGALVLLSIALASFLIAVAVTYISRMYWWESKPE